MVIPSESEAIVQSLDHGVWQIDTGFHRPAFDACYLVVERGHAAFIDTGTTHSVPRLLAALDGLGLAPAQVDHVIPTHVHLDHAGGAGQLMRALPNATLLVHPAGAQHLIDPAKLIASATGVYGEDEVRRSYGDIVGIDPARVRRSTDGMVLDLAGRPLVLLDTPGHARHHHCLWDARSRSVFTGDTFGIAYRELATPRGPWMLPSTTPIEFEPELLRRSIRRLAALEPRSICLTHYGRVDGGPGGSAVARLEAMLLQQLDAMVALAETLPLDDALVPALRQGFTTIHRDSLRAAGCLLPDERIAELLALDLDLNTHGVAVWLRRRAKRNRRRS